MDFIYGKVAAYELKLCETQRVNACGWHIEIEVCILMNINIICILGILSVQVHVRCGSMLMPCLALMSILDICIMPKCIRRCIYNVTYMHIQPYNKCQRYFLLHLSISRKPYQIILYGTTIPFWLQHFKHSIEIHTAKQRIWANIFTIKRIRGVWQSWSIALAICCFWKLVENWNNSRSCI